MTLPGPSEGFPPLSVSKYAAFHLSTTLPTETRLKNREGKGKRWTKVNYLFGDKQVRSGRECGPTIEKGVILQEFDIQGSVKQHGAEISNETLVETS